MIKQFIPRSVKQYLKEAGGLTRLDREIQATSACLGQQLARLEEESRDRGRGLVARLAEESRERAQGLDALRAELHDGLGKLSELQHQQLARLAEELRERDRGIDALRAELHEGLGKASELQRLQLARLAEESRERDRGIDALRAELHEGLGKLSELQHQLAGLRQCVLQRSRVDVVKRGDIKLFMYTDDASYLVLAENEKHYQLTAQDYQPPEAAATQPDAAAFFRREVAEGSLTTALLTHYWAHGLEFAVIDVGASYGFESIYTAQYIRRCGRANRVVAFEPGVAGTLLEHNVVLNHVAGLLTVERAAVSNLTGPMLMFGESGRSRNNRIVNRRPEGEDFSYVTQVHALDTYVERHGLGKHFIVKIGTQGAEPEMLKGMQRMLADRYTTLIIEFSPQAIRGRTAPHDFLASLACLGTVCDLGQRGPLAFIAGRRLRLVDVEDFERFSEVVQNRPDSWSDLLVIPHQLPGEEELLAALTVPSQARVPARPLGGPACPICADAEAVLFDGTRVQKIYTCPSCRHLFWDTVPTSQELLDFYRSEYCEQHGQEAIQECRHAYYREHVEEMVNLLGRPRGEVCLLDYGSSIPVLTHEARNAGVGNPGAVEVDLKAWEYARAHGLSILTPEQYEHLPDESVDIIRFSHVLEHLVDPAAVVATAVRKLRPGGLLYITQPSFPVFLPRRTDYPLKDSVYPTHLHFFSPLSLVRMVSRFPLEVIRLFSVDRQDEVYAELDSLIDLDYSRQHLADYASKGEPCRGVRANYPFYTGENSALYARKHAA